MTSFKHSPLDDDTDSLISSGLLFFFDEFLKRFLLIKPKEDEYCKFKKVLPDMIFVLSTGYYGIMDANTEKPLQK